MNLIDAVLFGSILITFINKCDRVKIACQSIVIGSMVGVDPEGGAFKQTTFYPFQQAATYAKGIALRSALDSPMKKTEAEGEMPYIQTASVYDEENGIVTIFAVNLDLREATELDCRLQFEQAELISHIQLQDDQPLAVNSIKNPERIIPKNIEIKDTVVLPPLSWNVLRYRVK